MSKTMMVARFGFDASNIHYKVWGEEKMVNGVVGSSIKIATGGFLNATGSSGDSGRFFVLFGICDAAAKLFELNPEVFSETVLSSETRKQFGIIDLTFENHHE